MRDTKEGQEKVKSHRTRKQVGVGGERVQGKRRKGEEVGK